MTSFSVFFQSIFPNINESKVLNNIFYLNAPYDLCLYYDGQNKSYNLVDLTTPQNILSITGTDALTLSDYYNNSLIPFSIRYDSFNNIIHLDTIISSYTANTNSYIFNPSSFIVRLGKWNGYDTISGSYANIKFFRDYKNSSTAYFNNPHSRYEEKEMLFDYKFYDSPSGTTAINSYIGNSATGVTFSSTGINEYDLFPINFKREFVTHGTNIPGGDFINNSSEEKRRGSNFGYGIFSAEAINNDILDYYGSTSATNISSFYVDPAYYYEDYEDKYHWKNLINYRNTIISSSRYPNGITYTKFIKVIEKYRHILYNFFQTAEQFLRFKSKTIQKGINIEPTLLDREKHNIDSAELTIEPMNMPFTAENINAFSTKILPISFTAEQVNSSTTETIDMKFQAQSMSAYKTNVNIITLTSYKESITKQTTENLYFSTIKELNSSISNIINFSVSGYQGINMTFSNPNQDTNFIFMNNYMTKEGSTVDDRYYYVIGTNEELNPELKTSNTVKTIVTSNKKVIETGLFPISLKGYIPFILFDNPTLTGSGTGANFNIKSGNVIGVNTAGVVNSTTIFDTNNNNLYFISTYNNVPLTGTLNNITLGDDTITTGTFTGVFLKYDFKDIGVDTDINYYRRYLKLVLQQQNNNNEFIKNNDSIFVIDNPIEKNTKLPLFYFYCYNNKTYYTTTQFRIPCYSANGTSFLISINPIFNGINIGKAVVGITNLVTKEFVPLEINTVVDTSQYIDSELTVFGNNTNGGTTVQIGYTTEHHTLTNEDISNGYITFGGSTTGFAINIGKGIFVYLNGGLQDTTFYNYSFDGTNNKIIFQNTASLIVGDIITIYYTY